MTPPDDFNPVVGQTVELEPGLRRIVAPNPSPMTYRGTNTYLLGARDLAVIDPGPKDADRRLRRQSVTGCRHRVHPVGGRAARQFQISHQYPSSDRGTRWLRVCVPAL